MASNFKLWLSPEIAEEELKNLAKEDNIDVSIARTS